MTNEIETVKLNKNYDTAIVINELSEVYDVDDIMALDGDEADRDKAEEFLSDDEVAIFWIEDSDSLPFIFKREDAENILIPAIREGKTIKHNTKTNNLYIYNSEKKTAVVEQYEDGYYTIDTIRLKYRQHHVI